LLSVSFGLYWLWIFMLLQSPTPLLDASPLADTRIPLNAFILAANILTYFLVGIGFRRLNFISRLKAFPSVLTVSLCCGTLALIVVPYLPVDQSMFNLLVHVLASLLIGASTAYFCLETGRVFAILGPQQVLFHGTFALLCGSAGAALVSLMPTQVQLAILLLVPLVMVFGLRHSMRTLATNRLYTQGLENKAHIPWRFLFVSALQGLGLGFLGALIDLHTDLPVKPIALCAFMVATVLLFFTALSVKLSFNHLVFRVGFPLMAVGFFVISAVDTALLIGSALLYTGYAYMYLINCCLCSYLAKGRGQSPLWIIGLATGALVVGQALGEALGVMSLPPSINWYAGLMAFLLVLASLFLSAGNGLNRGWGEVVPGTDERIRLDTETACQLIASERSLSKRESEVVLLITRGHTRRAVGGIMGISEETVKTHVTNIYTKTGVHSKEELVTLVETRAYNMG
jgi:DNA-binding CsgD family transcriptional regulator